MRSFCLTKLLCLSLGIISFAHAFHLAHNTRKHGSRSALDHSTRSEEGHHNDHQPSRRDVLIQSAGLALSSVMIGTPNTPAWAASDTAPKTIVITGANSGIGFEACQRLAAQGHSIVMACRSMAKAEDAVERIRQAGIAQGNLTPASCDLTSLASIKSFADSLKEINSIDTLCLNAGIARSTGAKDVARTADGFELTVGTNHFGHFYLNSLLLPKVSANGKIVVTASGVHDPESPGGAQGEKATLGDMKGLETEGRHCEMIDGAAFNPDKAYKDSKLCNVLFTRELQRRLEAAESTKGITANCFNPGLIVGTGLFRDQNPLFTKVFNFAATDLLKVGENPKWGGGCLTYMCNEVSDRGSFYSSDPGSSKYGDAAYGKQFTASAVSKEAQDDAKATRFWELTEKALSKVA